MKNFNFKKPFFILSVAVVAVVSFGFIAVNEPNKVTICHVPPGNPGNCHEITISTNALQTHLDHGDRLVCNSQADLLVAKDLLGIRGIDAARVHEYIIVNY